MRVNLRSGLLCAFLVSCGAPLAMFWMWPHTAALESEIAEVGARNQALAGLLADTVEERRRNSVSAFGHLVQMVAARGPAADIGSLMRVGGFTNICVTNARIVDQPHCGPAALARSRDIAAGAAQELAMARVRIGPDGRPAFFLVQPLNGGHVVGVAPAQPFRTLAQRFAASLGARAVVVDADGRAFVHFSDAWVAERRDLSTLPPLLAARGADPDGAGVMRFRAAYDGEEMLAGYARAAGAGWAVMLKQPIAVLRDKVEGAAASALTVLLVGLALSATAALVVAHRIARPITDVVGAAQRMALGDREARAPGRVLASRTVELAALGEAFNLMAERVARAHDQAAEAARRDPLTGLLNRAGFFDAARRLLAAGVAEGFTLYFVDVDRFKSVNDTHGHAAGDAVLRAVAERLRAAVGPEAVIARQGGDEFLVLAPTGQTTPASLLGERLQRGLRAAVEVGDVKIGVTASVGASVALTGDDDLPALVTSADHAMYQAKRSGGGVLRFFDQSLQTRLDEEVRLADELRDAVAVGGLGAEFQPIVHARTGALTGFEALSRWDSPSQGPVAPERFVALAESTGLIEPLGRRIREHAFALAAQLKRAGLDLPVSVNVSQAELAADGFAETVMARLEAHGLAPRALILEITESVFQTPGEVAMEALFELRRRGVGFALDDFGKGYCAHRLLRTYPVDRLKIAADFLGDVTADPGARAVVRSMIDLGRRLNLMVTVENIETAAQRDLVASLGADEIQGFWHYAPMPAVEAFEMARRLARQPMHAARIRSAV